MKYSELIQFEPIETVVQLREADTPAFARSALRRARHIRDDVEARVVDALLLHRPAESAQVVGEPSPRRALASGRRLPEGRPATCAVCR